MAVLETERTVPTNALSRPEVLTYERYLQEFLTEPVSMQPSEIIDGVRHYMTSPNWWHQQISYSLAVLLNSYKAVHGGQVAQAPLSWSSRYYLQAKRGAY